MHTRYTVHNNNNSTEAAGPMDLYGPTRNDNSTLHVMLISPLNLFFPYFRWLYRGPLRLRTCLMPRVEPFWPVTWRSSLSSSWYGLAWSAELYIPVRIPLSLYTTVIYTRRTDWNTYIRLESLKNGDLSRPSFVKKSGNPSKPNPLEIGKHETRC